MDARLKRLLGHLKDKKIGVFADDANLYHSYKSYGWRIDLEKFRRFLEKYCQVEFINYYVAVPDKSDTAFRGTQEFLRYIEPFVKIKKKKLKYIRVAGNIVKKGDVDVEIVLDVVRSLDNLDTVIVVSGDSDFLELRNYVTRDKGKEIIFAAYERNMAWELRQGKHIYVNRIKKQVVLQ